ncbi:TetR/AcrR family transcriptional regulator [Roseobacter sp.]|uniref:TetR/AcrR family transcriptional regulator n=1 Tax=Roseobacter sp. TaxID=1907202 RepID=UPI00385D3768
MSDHLTKEKWVQHGLRTLEKKGFNALKAEPLAKALKVSRGSFYWHFKDISVFQRAVLDLWRQRSTLQVIADIDRLDSSAGRLRALMQRAFNSDRDLERAVRAWAIPNPEAASAVVSVDNERINYINDLLAAHDAADASARSKATFLYWAYLGQMMMANGNDMQFTDVEFEKIIALFHS